MLSLAFPGFPDCSWPPISVCAIVHGQSQFYAIYSVLSQFSTHRSFLTPVNAWAAPLHADDAARVMLAVVPGFK